MTSIVSVSSAELAQRRQQLRRQRRLRWLQASWRTVAVSGLAGGLLWATTLPTWVIRKDQVTIEGNQFIPEQTLRTLIPFSAPQSLLKIEPQEIANALKAKAPIAEAKVERQLFPPGLHIQVEERHPVAIAIVSSTPSRSASAKDGKAAIEANSTNLGLLDESGVWIPMEHYKSLDPSLKLPTLKIVGRPEQYLRYWTKLYQAVSRSPIKVREIDWRDPANLILKTELGVVYFGSYTPKFLDQLGMLDRMRQLSSKVNPSQIAYIDLRNPDAPSLQLSKSQSAAKPGTPEN